MITSILFTNLVFSVVRSLGIWKKKIAFQIFRKWPFLYFLNRLINPRSESKKSLPLRQGVTEGDVLLSLEWRFIIGGGCMRLIPRWSKSLGNETKCPNSRFTLANTYFPPTQLLVRGCYPYLNPREIVCLKTR